MSGSRRRGGQRPYVEIPPSSPAHPSSRRLACPRQTGSHPSYISPPVTPSSTPSHILSRTPPHLSHLSHPLPPPPSHPLGPLHSAPTHALTPFPSIHAYLHISTSPLPHSLHHSFSRDCLPSLATLSAHTKIFRSETLRVCRGAPIKLGFQLDQERFHGLRPFGRAAVPVSLPTPSSCAERSPSIAESRTRRMHAQTGPQSGN